jgi:hypothetical protein
MGGVAAITMAGAIIIRTGMRTTGVPGISRVNSAWNIDDWALLGSLTHQARSRAPIGLPDILQAILDNAAQILAWQRREFLIALAAELQGIPTIYSPLPECAEADVKLGSYEIILQASS